MDSELTFKITGPEPADMDVGPVQLHLILGTVELNKFNFMQLANLPLSPSFGIHSGSGTKAPEDAKAELL